MKCPKCNQENKDTALMCEFCGERFDKSVEDNNEVKVSDEPVETGTNTVEKKSNTGLIIGAVIALVAVVGIIAALANGSDKNKTADKMFESYINTLTADSYEAYQKIELTNVELDINDPNVMMIENMLKGVSIELTNKVDKNQMKMEGDISLSLQGVNVGGEYYISKDEVGFKIPMLYQKAMYIKWIDLINLIKAESGVEFDIAVFEPYKELLALETYENKISLDPYIEVYEDFYSDALTDTKTKKETVETKDASEEVKGTEYSLEFDYEDSIKLNEEMVKALSEDENLKAFIIEFVERFIQTIIDNQDYKMYALLTSGDFNNYGITQWQDYMEQELTTVKAQINMGVNMGFSFLSNINNQAYSDINYEEIMEAFDMNMNTKWFVDENNYFRKGLTSVSINMEENDESVLIEGTSAAAYNKINEEIEFNGMEADAINLGTLTAEEVEALVNGIIESLGGDMFLESFTQ